MSDTRRYDIDALRAIAFGLLIAYHIGMFYVSWGWHVKSNYPAHWLEPLMLLLNQWRMPLIFFISGLAVNFLLGSDQGQDPGRDPGRNLGQDSSKIQKQGLSLAKFARLRATRLLLPLLFGMLIVVPPQAYYEALSNGVIERGYVDFLLRYFGFDDWPAKAFAGSAIGITWNHLWYLPYLLFYSLALVPLIALFGRPMARLRSAIESLSGFRLVLLPVLWLMPIGIWVFPHFPYIRHDLTTDWYAHAMFGSFFAFGYLIGRSNEIWEKLARLRWHTLILAIGTFALFRSMLEILPSESTTATNAAQAFVTYLNRWTWIVVALGWSHYYLNRPMPWLGYATRAVYPWYILHQTFIVVIGYELSQVSLGPIIEPILLIAITVSGCALSLYLIEHWLPWLRPLFGLKQERAVGRR